MSGRGNQLRSPCDSVVMVRRSSTRRVVLLALGLSLVGLAVATPASADPARPTDYRSTVLRVHPKLPQGVEVSVVGGDSFLELRVARGHSAVVPDYEQGAGTTPEPYLRFLADGTVERNERSIAAAINRSRYGTDPTAADPKGTPKWTVVARDGRYLWHDHRIHWMLPNRPKAVSADGRVDMGGPNGAWTVDLTVDDEPVVVTGELVLLASPSPVPWLGMLVLAAGCLIGLALFRVRAGRPAPHRALAGALAISSLLAVGVGTAQWFDIPKAAGGTILTAAIPAVALVASVVAFVARAARTKLVALAAAVAALGGWAVLRRTVLTRAVLPTSLPFAVDRAVTALALGVALAGVTILVWRPPTDAAAATASPTDGTAGTAPAPRSA